MDIIEAKWLITDLENMIRLDSIVAISLLPYYGIDVGESFIEISLSSGKIEHVGHCKDRKFLEDVRGWIFDAMVGNRANKVSMKKVE